LVAKAHQSHISRDNFVNTHPVSLGNEKIE
jgi:hypothetical protein